MMVKSVLARGICVAAVCLLAAMPATADLVTFDDVATGNVNVAMPAGYGGLEWDNFHVIWQDRVVPSGYNVGAVSGEHMAFSGWGTDPVVGTISASPGLNLYSAWFTAAYRDGLEVQVQGFQSGISAYVQTLTLDTDAPQLVTFDWLNLDEVRFTPVLNSGTPTYGSTYQFTMDNLSYSIVPVPGAALLGFLGLGFAGIKLRRRVDAK